MFDELKEDDDLEDDDDFEDDDDDLEEEDDFIDTGGGGSSGDAGLFPGMSATQSLVIAVMLFLNVCVLGFLVLMVTGRVFI